MANDPVEIDHRVKNRNDLLMLSIETKIFESTNISSVDQYK